MNRLLPLSGAARARGLAGLFLALVSQTALADVFINEIHYDNSGTDTGEAVEIAGPAGTDLTGWTLVRYNGNGGAVYGTDALSGTIADLGSGFGVVVVNYPANGLQNGSPDGIALVDAGNSVVQFLSYEGSFIAVGGPANGMTSTDIGVSEPNTTPIGDSLQLTGAGSAYADFSWASPQPNTFGAANTGQVFTPGPSGPKINEFSASTTGVDVEYVEIYGAPSTDYSTYSVIEIEGDSGSNEGTIDEVIGLGTTDANGLYLVSLPANALENGTISLLLVENFTGSVGNDLDPDDDGVLDTTPWSSIADSVAVNDGGAGDRTYGVPSLGPNYDGVSSFAPGGASRIPDGLDTDSATDWVRNDFDLAGIPPNTGTPIVGEAINTPGAPNEAYVPPPEVCGDPTTPISAIQGSGNSSPLDGNPVSIEGIVVGDFQDGAAGTHGDLDGFFVQEEDAEADADPATSEGIFVFDGASPAVDVSVGDKVRVSGTVDEFFGLTEITATTFIEVCDTGATLPTAAQVALPLAADDELESVEGMRVTLPQEVVIVEYFNFDRFGEIIVASERLVQPTSLFDPGTPERLDLAEMNALDQLTIDDGRTNQNPDPAIHPNGAEFDLGNLFRGGDTLQDVTGVMHYAFGQYRLQPTQGATYVNANPRTALPDEVGGGLKVASFNVLNYFSTLDNAGPICGPLQNESCRGADNATEFTRQRDKIIAALSAIDADVVGLVELENHPDDAALIDLVQGLNDANGPGTYSYVDVGVTGPDVIKVALIFKPGSVTPVGSPALLDSSVDPLFLDDKNRVAVAQSFADNGNGGVFTAVINHLKSKGADCNDVGDPDTGDGSGNCNQTRADAAMALADWLATDPTGSGDVDAVLLGDFNAYDKEDPIDVLTGLGFADLAMEYVGEFAYGYVFDAQVGYLDFALANGSLLPQTTGATIWHINADEPDLLDYDTSFKQPAQDAIYAPDPYRSSDHDPVIAGLDLLNFEFSGFFQPIRNPPASNAQKAGSSVPVKFRLDGDLGLDIFADGFPQSLERDCDTGEIGAGEATETAGGSELVYDAEDDQYVYVWQTAEEWKGSCRRLVVQLRDGSYHVADFRFK